MPSDHTRSAILSAAERLYADRGFADVTLRDIVAAAGVNLAAVNYHFGSKDELIAELFVTRSLATNRERLNELRQSEERGGGRADIDAVLRALVGPTLRGCLGPDRERSPAARFMIRASIESVPPIRRIKNREIDHLRKFAAAMRRSLPGRGDVDLYWGLHFALAMAHHTIRDSERLTKLSEGLCDLNDVDGMIDRVVAVSVLGTDRERGQSRRTRCRAAAGAAAPVSVTTVEHRAGFLRGRNRGAEAFQNIRSMGDQFGVGFWPARPSTYRDCPPCRPGHGRRAARPARPSETPTGRCRSRTRSRPAATGRGHRAWFRARR